MIAPRSIIRLAAGTGLLARRETALVFVPDRDVVLVEAFTASPPGGELQAVASTAVAAGFAVGPFVCVAWSAGVQVMAFGDVTVETDQPSLPMLSGAGSRTWVEHSFAMNGSAVIEVPSEVGAIDASTDLGAGVAPAGGFRLELQAAAAAVEVDVEVAVEVEPPAAIPTPVVRAPPVDADDPTAALAAIQAAAVGADGEPLAPAGAPAATARAAPRPRSDEPVDPHDADVTLPPGVPEPVPEPDARGSLVDAKRCGAGHPNPPTAATCEVCGEFLAPGSASIVHVVRPSLGRLRLDDGELIELDHELLVGRNPDRDTDPARHGLRRLRLLGEKVSRSHLEIRFQGWEIFVADCGSTNGTFVVPHPGGPVAPLEPGRLQMVEPGATLYFGSRSLTVVGRQERS